MIKEATKKTLVLLVCIIVVIMPFVATAQVGADCVTTDGKAGKIVSGVGAMGASTSYCQPNNQTGSNNPVAAAVGYGLDKLGGYIFKDLTGFLMGLTSLILIFSGWLLDSVLSFTVTGMSDQIGTGTTIGNSITEAWGIIRDVANMVFIFVLLYTAFRTMFLSEISNVGRPILNIVLIAILINFSLFFAKVVIDASNIVADGFYRAINQGNSLVLDSSSDQLIVGTARYQGISGGVMKMLGMQNIYGKGALGDGKSEPTASRLLLFGTVSGVFMIVASVVFFMASIMFIARFIILIFLMILAPFAFIAFIIPGFSGRFWDWWASLFNQAFFAPVFFALMWVAFKVGSAIVTKPLNSEYGTDWSYIITDPKKAFGAVINYVLVLGLFITALTISKQMASKGSTAGAFGAITAGAGAATFGVAGLVARNTLGRRAAGIASDKDLQRRAAMGDTGARLKLWTAQKTAGSSFDARSLSDTWVGKTTGIGALAGGLGKASGQGGYKASRDEKTDKRRKPIDDILRQFRNDPKVLAGFLERQGEGDQVYMYDKLSARDRAAVDEELDTKYGTTGGANPTTKKLRAKLSPEEKEKTEKAAKESKSDALAKERVDTLHRIATDPGFASTFTPTALDGIISKLPPKQARKLSHEARMSSLIIPRLSIRHLTDLMSEGDLQSDEITAIKTHATATQTTWMNDPTRAALWTP